jgi:hypothetical protein
MLAANLALLQGRIDLHLEMARRDSEAGRLGVFALRSFVRVKEFLPAQRAHPNAISVVK